MADMITEARLRYTQDAVADALGLSQQSVSKRTRGVVEWKREELVKLAAHLREPLNNVVRAWMAEDPPEPTTQQQPENGAPHPGSGVIRLIGGPLDGDDIGSHEGPLVPISGTEISVVLTDEESGQQTLSDAWTYRYFVAEMNGTAIYVADHPGPAEPGGGVISRPILHRRQQ